MRETRQLKTTNLDEKVVLHQIAYLESNGSSRDSFDSLQRAHWAPRQGDEKLIFFGKIGFSFFFFHKGFPAPVFHSPLVGWLVGCHTFFFVKSHTPFADFLFRSQHSPTTFSREGNEGDEGGATGAKRKEYTLTVSSSRSPI